jgi:putative flippase GtrA
MLGLLKKHKETFIKFCIVGGISTILNYAIFYILLKFLSVNHLPASTAGYVSGVFLGFYLNKIYTFDAKSPKYGVELIKYFGVYGASLGVGLLLLESLTMASIPATYANIFMIGLTTITNYIGSKYFVFARTGIIKKANYAIYKYRYFLRYIIIGIFSILLELIIIIIMSKILPYEISILFGFFVAMTASYLINSKINFNIPKNDRIKAFLYFGIFSIVIYSINLVVINFFFNNTALNYSFSRVISSSVFFTLSYVLHRKITFKNTKKVGIAIYLSKNENIQKIKQTVGDFVDWIHIDIVDKSIRKDAKEIDIQKGFEIQKEWPHLKKMTHIMSKTPSKWIKKVAPFSDYIIIHSDTNESTIKCLQKIKSINKKAGICIMAKEDTKLEKNILNYIDILQLLGIDHPGESGQVINPRTFKKLVNINKSRKNNNYKFKVCVDGGIKESNSKNIYAEYIVSGSAILNSERPRETIYELKIHKNKR